MPVKWQNIRGSMPVTTSAWSHQNNIAHGSGSGDYPNLSQGLNRTQGYPDIQNKSNLNFQSNDRIKLNKITEEEYKREEPPKSGLSQPKIGGSLSFKGMPLNDIAMKISPMTRETSLKIVGKIDGSLEKLFNGYIQDFVGAVSNPDFVKHLNLSEEQLQHINNGELIWLPEQSMAKKVLDTVVSPVTVPVKALYGWVFKNTKSDAETFSKIAENYSNVLDLFKNTERWENIFRGFHKLENRKGDEEFIIPTSLLHDKYIRKRFKTFDPGKGQYSTNILGPGNRAISGLIGATYLSTDAYNTTMSLTGNKKISAEERKSRFFQESARIGLSAYLMGIALTMFKKQADRSMKSALLITASITILTEILGRKLVGKPVLPSTKEKLDQMDERRKTAHGIIPTIGRFITGEKIQKLYDNTVGKFTPSGTEMSKRFDTSNTFGNFVKDSKTVSFTGFKAPQLFKKQEFELLMQLMENLNESMKANTQSTIEKGFKKIGKFNDKDLSAMTYEQAVRELDEIPVGQRKTKSQKLLETLCAPYYWVKSWTKGVKKAFFFIQKKLNKVTDSDMLKHYKEDLTAHMEEYHKDQLQSHSLEHYQDMNELPKDFIAFREKCMGEDYWNRSQLNEKQKEAQLIRDFLEDNIDKFKEELDGTKNTLLWLKKRVEQIAKKNETLKNTENPLATIVADPIKYDKEIQELKKAIESQTMRAFSQGNTEYNSSAFSIINVNVARAITTGFLVSDSYNLTMQHSKNDKKESIANSKQRAIQEGARITVSAYIMNFIYTWMRNFVNGSLLGAFTTTALTSNLNEILSRKVVGLPIAPKSKEALEKIDQKMQQSHNPIRKTLAYLIGKKHKGFNQSAKAPAKTTENPNKTSFSADKKGMKVNF